MRAYAHVAIAGHHEGRGDWPSVARYAGIAAESAAAPRLRGLRLAARRLLVEAQMRLGQPRAALATAEQLRSATQAESERRLHERLRRGLRAVEEAERARRTKPAPDALHQLAEAHLSDLGNPRQALEYCFRILSDFGQYPRLPDVAAILFGCYEKLGADATSHRLLERAAKNLGPGSPSPRQALLLAEAAAASGQPEMAIRWLRRLPRGVDLDRGAAGRATAVYLRAAEHFQASGAFGKALAAWRRAAALRVPPLAARAAVLAGEVLAKAGRHGDAARHLLAALAPQADPETMRRARRALAVGRLRRLDPVAYDAAHVGQLAVFGFLGRAVALGEQTLGGLPMDDTRRELGRHVADAFDGLVAYHLAAGDVERATGAVGRWLRLASPKDDLPRALAHLAACQELAGQHRARIETLSRLAIEFADRPEGAEARRELRLLNAPARP